VEFSPFFWFAGIAGLTTAVVMIVRGRMRDRRDPSHDASDGDPAADRPTTALSPDALDQLDDLLALRENGEISAEEHERRANQIISESGGTPEKPEQ
jgi:hypothetical protein